MPGCPGTKFLTATVTETLYSFLDPGEHCLSCRPVLLSRPCRYGDNACHYCCKCNSRNSKLYVNDCMTCISIRIQPIQAGVSRQTADHHSSRATCCIMAWTMTLCFPPGPTRGVSQVLTPNPVRSCHKKADSNQLLCAETCVKGIAKLQMFCLQLVTYWYAC